MGTSFKQQLKAKAHILKPIILLGNKGLTPAVIEETNVALLTHELIKVKLTAIEREQRKTVAQELCQQLKAELIQIIGNIAVVYRKNCNQ